MAGSIVQAGYNVDDSGAGSTTIAVTLTGVSAGNHLIVHVGWSSSAATCSVSDGTAYTAATSDLDDTNEDDQIFYLENVGAGSHTITATFSGSESFRRIRAYEVSGLQTSSSKDQSAGQKQASPGTGTDAVSSGASSATTNANDFVMGFSQDTADSDPGAGTISAGTGYTLFGVNRILAVESKSVAATGAQTATFTISANKTQITSVIAWKESGGGGGGGSFNAVPNLYQYYRRTLKNNRF